jgi:hypothetical protein
MKDTVSMLDWGVYKLERKFDNFENQEGYQGFQVMVSYDTGKNKIKIEAWPHSAAIKNRTVSEAKSLCFDMFKYIREKLWVDSETGEGKFTLENKDDNYSVLWTYFTHTGSWSRKKGPSKIYKEIDGITHIEIIMPLSENKRPIQCKAPLMSKEVLFSEPKE